MRQQFVLDTSALINDPTIWKQFPHSDILIPIATLNELDKLKKQSGEVGRSARVCIRSLDEISNTGDISVGILLDDDIMLKIDTTYNNLSGSNFLGFGDPNYGDTQILACLYSAWLAHPERDVTLVSNDINLRIKAKARGIDAIEHDNNPLASEIYSGNQIIENEEAGLILLKAGSLNPDEYELNLNSQECVMFESKDGEQISLGRKISENKIKLIKKVYPWGISAKNIEQSYLIDMIMDPNIDLITAIGVAGVGKSICALATALELVLAKKQYEKLIIYRPIQPMGSDIGFLPGELNEKLAPWFQAILDNFEVLFNSKNSNGGDWKKDLEMFERKGKIEMSALTYIRGRSIANSIILIDEAQNLSKEEIKTILTRAGENTKIILSGDIEQIDRNDLDASDNGLTYVINKFKNLDLAGHVTLVTGERSRLATISAKIL